MLLPYLELQGLYDQYNPNICASKCGGASPCPNAVGDPLTVTNGACNAAVVSTRLAVFSCPSDNGDPYEKNDSGNGPYYGIVTSSGFPLMLNGVECKGAKTNYDFSAYRANDLSAMPCHKWATQATAKRRIFGENSSTRIDDVHDGTSNTFAMAETLYSTRNSTCPAWGYAGHVGFGVDLGSNGINNWYNSGGPGHSITGQLGSMARRGAIIPAGRTC